ncbi:MAG TPA: hypothetical protein VMV16_02235 [Solirubrobacteraceae bacterium]|jgi:hypothetical protein|nr:hypothetical protein [Solirubrobacteraceae bacterium]
MTDHNEAFDQAFWQAVDDMHAGAVKPIESYLRLVPRHERDELGRMLADVLLARGAAPTPSAQENEAYTRALAVIDDVLGSAGPAGMLPNALKTMRGARGIEPDEIVEKLAADFDITGTAGRKALERNYHRLETGTLLGTKLATRLLESLAQIFDIDVRDLVAGAQPTGKAPRLTVAPAMGRGSGATGPSGRGERAPDLLPDPEVERVERLFHGGPDA